MNWSRKVPFVTTMDYRDYPEYVARSRVLSCSDLTIRGQLKFVPTILRAARDTGAVLLQSSSGRIHPDLLAAILMGLWHKSRRPAVIMMGCMWQKDSGLPGILQKILIKLADRAIYRYAPQSTDELSVFSEVWGISPNKLRFLQYFYTFTEKDLSKPISAPENFIFSGGNSHRDYDSLIQAIDVLPEYNFVIASRLLDGMKLPANVRVGQVPRSEFIRLMRVSSAVVVPILKGLTRATGQQTYLNAMLLEKPTIISDSLGVRDHVRDGETAMVVEGSPESYVQAIRHIFAQESQSQIAQMCKSARESVLRDYSFEKHCERLLEILDEAVEEYYSTG